MMKKYFLFSLASAMILGSILIFGQASAAPGTPLFYAGYSNTFLISSSVTCGDTYSFNVEGYSGTTIWLKQIKNGTTIFDAPFFVPMSPYTSTCNKDEGSYELYIYQVTNIAGSNTPGAFLGSSTFRINPKPTPTPTPLTSARFTFSHNNGTLVAGRDSWTFSLNSGVVGDQLIALASQVTNGGISAYSRGPFTICTITSGNSCSTTRLVPLSDIGVWHENIYINSPANNTYTSIGTIDFTVIASPTPTASPSPTALSVNAALSPLTPIGGVTAYPGQNNIALTTIRLYALNEGAYLENIGFKTRGNVSGFSTSVRKMTLRYKDSNGGPYEYYSAVTSDGKFGLYPLLTNRPYIARDSTLDIEILADFKTINEGASNSIVNFSIDLDPSVFRIVGGNSGTVITAINEVQGYEAFIRPSSPTTTPSPTPSFTPTPSPIPTPTPTASTPTPTPTASPTVTPTPTPIISSSVSCRLAVSSFRVAIGNRLTWVLRSNPSGYRAFWYGTKNGVADAVKQDSGFTTDKDWLTDPYPAGSQGDYLRWMELRDSNDKPVCSTSDNPISFSVVGGTGAVTPTPTPTPTPILTPTPTPLVITNQNKLYSLTEINDGDIVRGQGDIAVWIVKIAGEKRFKRWLFGPQIFQAYGHLGFDKVKNVSKETLNRFDTAVLIRKEGEAKVYELTDFVPGVRATRRWIPTAEIFLQRGFDFESVYVVNAVEFNLYTEGTPLPVSQINKPVKNDPLMANISEAMARFFGLNK